LVQRVRANTAAQATERQVRGVGPTLVEEEARLVDARRYRQPGSPPSPSLTWGNDLSDEEK
jgi:hypothetical protein